MADDPGVKDLVDKKNWQKERKTLRDLILDCGLDEAVKWGKLCYSYDGSNVVIIYGMKNYCALGFFKGSLLKDPDDVLVRPGKHSQAMRQMRFKSLEEIEESEDLIREFIEKAVQAEKDGMEVDFDEKDNLDIPDELQDALDDDAELAEAFEELTRAASAATCCTSGMPGNPRPAPVGSGKPSRRSWTARGTTSGSHTCRN